MQGDLRFDRTLEDVGTIVEFGHVNLRVPDQRLATIFYVTGMGFTRDPYLVTGVDNMWINVGTTQFHLPTGPAQVLGGTIVVAVPNLAGLASRLSRVASLLAETRFTHHAVTDAIHVTCPWGNRLRCIEGTSPRLGIVAVEIHTPPGTAAGIAAFYRTIFAAPSIQGGHGVSVPVGLHSQLIFHETDETLAPFDGAHIQIALSDFSGPHARLLERGLITEESSQHQYRFHDIVDLQTGAVLCQIEHEVRSMRHPMFARALINRDPEVTNAAYATGREVLVLGAEPA